MPPRVRRRRHHVQGTHLFGTTLDEHLHQASAHKARATRDDTDLGHRRIGLLAGGQLHRREVGRAFARHIVGEASADRVLILVECGAPGSREMN
eukprot:scaffold19768_cov128-Isochrysis_galbana.AAC.1